MTEMSPLEQAQNALGIPPIEKEQEKEPEKIEQPNEEPKPKTEDDPEEDDSDDDDDGEYDGEDDKDAEHPKSVKKNVPLKKFLNEKSKRKELEAELAELKKPKEEKPQTKQAKDTSELVQQAVEKIVSKHSDLDKEGMTDIVSAVMEAVSELSPKEKHDLPDDVKEKLKVLDSMIAEKHSIEEKNYFEKEWNEILPNIKKQYPNASDSQLVEAKKEIDKISHTKEFYEKDLDYVVFKKSDVIKTILGTAPKSKSLESKGNSIVDENPNTKIDFTSPDMSPEKLQVYMNNEKQSQFSEANTKPKFL